MKTDLLIINILVNVSLVIGRKFKIRGLTPADGGPVIDKARYVSVFGVKVIAQSSVCNKNLQYTANILAQLLDGNEDGLPDDKRVITQLQQHKSALLIYSTKDSPEDHEKPPYSSFTTLVTRKCNRHLSQWATVLAVSRLVVAFGLSPAYPRTFGKKTPSILHGSLKFIVGDCGYAHDKTLRWPDCTGHVFYNNTSCDAVCMAIEYLAQLITIALGVFPATSETGNGFWDIKSKTDLLERDPNGYKLMRLIKLKLPANAPTGHYRPGRNGYRMARIPLRQFTVDKLGGKVVEIKL